MISSGSVAAAAPPKVRKRWRARSSLLVTLIRAQAPSSAKALFLLFGYFDTIKTHF